MQSGLSTARAVVEPLSHTTTDDDKWDIWLAGQPLGHVLQLSGWRRLKQQFGWRGATATHSDAAGRLQAGSQLLLKRSSGLALAYAPRGPVTNWHDRSQTEPMLHELRARARELGAVVLKIEPELVDSPANRRLLESYGFVPSRQTVQPPSTIVLDLDGSEDDILARMKSKWRYNIRLAERKGVRIRELERQDLPIFHALMRATGQRDGFHTHSAEYFSAAYDLLVPDHAVYLLAEYGGEPLAAIVVAAAGATACYLWGASSDLHRNLMPNHALQWAGMRWARSRGTQRYDFWGIPDDLGRLATAMHGGDGSGVPSDELPIDLDNLPEGELWGVYRFKQGFGGNVVRMVGAWDTALEPFGYHVYQLGLTARDFMNAARRQWQSSTRPGSALASKVTAVTRAEEWRAALNALPDPHVLQSWEWGEVKAQTGWQAQRFVLTSPAGKAAFQFLWRQPVAQVPVRVAYVPKGPTLDWANLDLVEAVLGAVERQAAVLGCIYVKIDPDVREDTTVGRLVLHALQQRGWRSDGEQVQFKNTAYSDLSDDEETMLAEMKQKWRYNVRLAEKRGVQVRLGTEQDFAAFYALYAETGTRDGFLIRPFDYYAQTWRTFLQTQAEQQNPAGGALLLAEHPDDPFPVAGLFLMRYGSRAWYFYGASSERHRRDMPNYLLQWEALRWAKAQGCTIYDWWGAPTHPEDPADAMQGVWQFKQGFGACLQPHIGAWDYVASPLLYQIYQKAMPAVLDWMRRSHQDPPSAVPSNT